MTVLFISLTAGLLILVMPAIPAEAPPSIGTALMSIMAVTNDAISDLLLILGSIAVSVKPSLLPALKHLAKRTM